MNIQKMPGDKTIALYAGTQELIPRAALREKIISLVHRWERGDFPELTLSSANPASLFEMVKSAYDRFLIAAGGLVTNKSGRLLVILRNGKWDLPKGKIEPHESIQAGAIREVMEETGLKNVKVKGEFARTRHSYLLDGQRVLKETVWYLMTCADDRTLPQHNEGITAAEWIAASGLRKISSNTYESILLLLKAFFANNA